MEAANVPAKPWALAALACHHHHLPSSWSTPPTTAPAFHLQLQMEILRFCGAMGLPCPQEYARAALLSLAAMRNLPGNVRVHETAITCIKNLAMGAHCGA